MASSLYVAFVALLARRAHAESHTISFTNNCGFGTPRLLVGQILVSNGSDYMSDEPITSGVAYLDQDDCAAEDSNSCMEIEIDLSNDSPSFVDISLVPPQTYRDAACVAYYNGCDGASLACTEPGCLGAFTSEDGPSSNGTVLMCEGNDVNVAVTFCDCTAPSAESSTSASVVITTTSRTIISPSATSQRATSSSTVTLHSSPSLLKETVSLVDTSRRTPTPQVTSSFSSRSASSGTLFSSIIQSTLTAETTTTPFATSSDIASSESSLPQPTISMVTTSSTSSAPTFTAQGTTTKVASSRPDDVAAIVGGVLGGLLVTLVLGILAIFCIRRRRGVTERRRGLNPFTGEDEMRSHSAYRNTGGNVTSYAPVSSAGSPMMYSPHPWAATSETVLDIRTPFPDHTRTPDTETSRASSAQGDNPFILPPMSSLSSFSLLSPPVEEAVASVESSVAHHSSETYDPFADAQAVDDPPPSYMG